ncbi:phage baseplate plug family protein [Pseudodesulfovibrio pelocollis]|uniref:phage baseplate plug family protein n=1 Tax=Pseudodesulfovibrio pelocollis TaxID=3051432 RepID=UPI00255AA5BE|nr:hypothetical protein [Pseudodesulfovibrio sp. SB368]
MAVYRIPTTSTPQTFTVSLGGTEYQLTLRHSDAEEAGWVMDIDLPDNGGSVLAGLPLVTGTDLLGPHRHLGFGGGLAVWSDDHDRAPREGDLGNGVALYFVTDDEVDA